MGYSKTRQWNDLLKTPCVTFVVLVENIYFLAVVYPATHSERAVLGVIRKVSYVKVTYILHHQGR